MNKKLIIIIVVVAVIVVTALAIVMWAAGVYNGMVNVEEEATTALANVQSSYQRRADLIPNLVETVKGYATHEKETLEGVITARSKATDVTLTTDNSQEYQKVQGELSQALGRLIAISEAYPELKANESFQSLQVQLEGTENRINVARNQYNEAVQQYNVTIRRFPNSLLAGIFGFEKMNKFEAAIGSETAPQVKF